MDGVRQRNSEDDREGRVCSRPSQARQPGVPARILATLCFLAAAAYFARNGHSLPAGMASGSVILPWLGSSWSNRVVALMMTACSLACLQTAYDLSLHRYDTGLPWMRTAFVLLSVAGASLTAAALFYRRVRENRTGRGKTALFVCILTVLVLIEANAPLALLIGDRLMPGLGGVEIILLGLWGVWVAGRLNDRSRSPNTRMLAWKFFSIVFFAQFLLGILGYGIFLMTGRLHLPVPGVILAGPFFRGGGYVMTAIFGLSVVLVGAAWCSHLCYFGVWDHAAAQRTAPNGKSSFPQWFRPFVVVFTIAAAASLGYFGADSSIAVLLGLLLGILIIPLAGFVSRKKGIPFYCRNVCPMGFVSKWLGRLSPWRVQSSESCNGCRACLGSCRQDAIVIKNGRCEVTASCNLCRDCLSVCGRQALHMDASWGRRLVSPRMAENLFVALITIMHVVFLATARI